MSGVENLAGVSGIMLDALVDTIRRQLVEPEITRLRRRCERLEADVEAQAAVLDRLSPSWRAEPRRR